MMREGPSDLNRCASAARQPRRWTHTRITYVDGLRRLANHNEVILLVKPEAVPACGHIFVEISKECKGRIAGHSEDLVKRNECQ